MKVLIAVTHLLGAGHLSRALTLGRAFASSGHQAVVLSGGRPVNGFDISGVELVQLPPLASDGVNFSRFLAEDGELADAAYMETRREKSVSALTDFAPDILITELYPFGRRGLADEFLSLLGAAQAMAKRPTILASIRDILAPPSRPEKATRTLEVLSEFYDGVLVHSDESVTPLSASWPVSPTLTPLLHYTGYVAPPIAPPHPDRAGSGEVLVSAGGGSVGDKLFANAIAAASLSDQPWRLMVGGKEASARIATLSKLVTSSNVIVGPLRPDFRQMLHHAACSVSMCGYNTALDLLQSGVPAALVPFDAGGETEQTLRATTLERLHGVTSLSDKELSPAALLAAVSSVQNAPRRATTGFDFLGAERAVEIATQLRGAQR